MADNNLEIDDSIPERVLVVAAHPDDIEFGMAGSVARWVKAGAHVTYALHTDGDA
ncbi:MAG: PIG-L deacetylase family protein, partial [Anaerolineae bacterium]